MKDFYRILEGWENCLLKDLCCFNIKIKMTIIFLGLESIKLHHLKIRKKVYLWGNNHR